MSTTKKEPAPANKCVIDCRGFYLHIYQPTKAIGSNKPKYNGQFAWPQSDKATTGKVVAAFNYALKVGKEKGTIPANAVFKPTEIIKNGNTPTKNGTPRGPEYKDMYYVSAKSDGIPGIAYLNDQKGLVSSINEKDVMSGDNLKIEIGVYCYPADKEKAIACGIAVALNHVVRVSIGERLVGGAGKIEDAFPEFAAASKEDIGFGDDFGLGDDFEEEDPFA